MITASCFSLQQEQGVFVRTEGKMDDTTYSKQPAAFSQEGGSWKIVLPATWPWPMNSWRTAGGWMAVTELEIKFSPLWFKFSKTILHLVDSSYPKHLFELQDIQWCNGVVWIIVMFLSAIWTLILTAPINCREFIQTCLDDEKLIYILDGLRVSTFFPFLVSYSFKELTG